MSFDHRERAVHDDQYFQSYQSLQQVTTSFAVTALKAAFHISPYSEAFSLPSASSTLQSRRANTKMGHMENCRTDPKALNTKRKASALMVTIISSLSLPNSTRCCHRAPTCRRSRLSAAARITGGPRLPPTSDSRMTTPRHAEVERETKRNDGSGKRISPPPARRRPGDALTLPPRDAPRTPRRYTGLRQINKQEHPSTPRRRRRRRRGRRGACPPLPIPAAVAGPGTPAQARPPPLSPLGARRVSRETEPF